MKTTGIKTFRTSKKSLAAVSNPKVGSVVYDMNNAVNKRELYGIVGASRADIAMVRLFDQNELTPLLARKCYQLMYKIELGLQTEENPTQLYADTSGLIVKDYLQMATILGKYPERVVSKIFRTDIHRIIKTLQTINTISKDVKNKYFDA